jgi:hypothetical protein
MINLSEALVTRGLAVRRPTSGAASPAVLSSPLPGKTPPPRAVASPLQAPLAQVSPKQVSPKQAPPKQVPLNAVSPILALLKQAPPTQAPPTQAPPPMDIPRPPPLVAPSIPTAQKFLQPTAIISVSSKASKPQTTYND